MALRSLCNHGNMSTRFGKPPAVSEEVHDMPAVYAEVALIDKLKRRGRKKVLPRLVTRLANLPDRCFFFLFHAWLCGSGYGRI